MGKKQNKNNQAHHVPGDKDMPCCGDDASSYLSAHHSKAPALLAAVLDRHALYEQAVQSPDGDIAYIERFYRQYVSLGVRNGAAHLSTRCACCPLLPAPLTHPQQEPCGYM
jgi:hypothetical protein